MEKPLYKVGDELIWGNNRHTVYTVVGVNISSYDLHSSHSNYIHKTQSLEGVHENTRKLTKLEKALK